MAHAPDKRAKITEEGLRRWEDMGVDILGNIFKRVPRYDLFCSVSLVCHSWQLVCWHLLFLQKDMLDLSAIVDTVGFLGTVKYFQEQLGYSGDGLVLLDGAYCLMVRCELRLKVMRLLRRLESSDVYTLDDWRLSIRTISVPLADYVTDELLLYVAARAPSVESLVLMGCSNPKVYYNYIQVLDCWTQLKYEMMDDHCLIRAVEIIRNKFCKLSSLEVRCPGLHFTGDTAKFIIRSLPRIRSLKLKAAYLHLDGARVIFNEGFMLETFEISECVLMKDQRMLCRTTCTVRFFGRGLERNWRVEAVGD